MIFLTAQNKLADIQNPMIIKLSIFDSCLLHEKELLEYTHIGMVIHLMIELIHPIRLDSELELLHAVSDYKKR